MTSVDINTAAEELEDDHSGELELLPPARPVMSSAIATLHEHHAAMGYAADLAAAMVDTEMVPTRYRGRAKKGDAAAAILYGAELGLNPIQSLQNIFAVHGSPSMYARTMKALLRRQGYKFKTIEESDTVHEVHGWEPGSDPKIDDPDEISRWTIEDAQKAEFAPVMDAETGDWKTFTKKNGETAVLGNMKYVTQPKQMLYAKATAEVCRKLAPDVLLGIAYSTEEMESEREPITVTAERPATRRRGGKGVDGLAARAQAAEAGEEPIDAETVEDCESDAAVSGWKSPDPQRAWNDAIAKHGEPVVDGDTGCHRWQGALDAKGYGFFGRGDMAHRFAYAMTNGPIPEGLCIDHVWERGCRFHDCVNTEHLEAVTLAENGRRSTQVHQWYRDRNECSHGHEYTPENTRMYKGARICKTCNRDRVRKHRDEGAEASSGATLPLDSHDQEPGGKSEKSGLRKAVEKRTFGLIGEIKPPLSREDRISLYRSIIGRDQIDSTNDLSDSEVTLVGDQIYKWGKAGELDDKIRDIVNIATLRAEQDNR